MREISRLYHVMGLLRHRVHREMPLQHIALLLAVSEQPGITMPELMRVLDMPQGTVSRNVKTLSSYVDRTNVVALRKGYDLLRTQPDAANRRVLAVYLTSQGEVLIRDLARTLRMRNSGECVLDGLERRESAMPGCFEMVVQ